MSRTTALLTLTVLISGLIPSVQALACWEKHSSCTRQQPKIEQDSTITKAPATVTPQGRTPHDGPVSLNEYKVAQANILGDPTLAASIGTLMLGMGIGAALVSGKMKGIK
ncbi:MAG: hypothetical protein ABI743_10490 [bacterium]